MKSHLVEFMTIVLAVDAVNGLKCYQCEHSEGIEGAFSEKYCKNGKKPDNSLGVKCPTDYDVCVKVFAERRLDNGKNIKFTYRDCGKRENFHGYGMDKCDVKNSTELSKLSLVNFQIPDTVRGNVCLCSADVCNSSSILKVTRCLIVAALGVYSSKLICNY